MTSIQEKILNKEYDNKLPFVRRSVDAAAFQAYQNETARLLNEFESDLFEYLGIRDNPKRDLLFSKAWDIGHAHGYGEVLSYAEDLVELIE